MKNLESWVVWTLSLSLTPIVLGLLIIMFSTALEMITGFDLIRDFIRPFFNK